VILFVKNDAELEFLRNLFVANPHLQLLHLTSWEFTVSLRWVVPPSVRFLKIAVLADETQFTHNEPDHQQHHQHGHHHTVHQLLPPLPMCFQNVRALSIQCPIARWKELLPAFSKYNSVYNFY
jgi:hypothetical protein